MNRLKQSLSLIKMSFSAGKLIFMGNTCLKSKMNNTNLPANNMHQDNRE